jgi:branched-chain amino acid transport system ATP-binding protein
MPLLEVIGLTKRFGGLTAVDGVDLSVEKGEIVGLIGPNGAGKTTFVNLLTGMLQSTAGQIRYAGRDITRMPPHQRCRLGLTRTFQVPQPFSDMTVRENVVVAALFGNSPGRVRAGEASEVVDDVLAAVGLDFARDKPTGSLTTAGLKRLEVARCLATRPDVIFLDEPLGGLNRTELDEALGLVRRLKAQGRTIVFIEHIVPAVMAVSDRVLVLANGRKLAEGTPKEILDNAEVQRAYLGDVAGAVSRRRGRTRGQTRPPQSSHSEAPHVR